MSARQSRSCGRVQRGGVRKGNHRSNTDKKPAAKKKPGKDFRGGGRKNGAAKQKGQSRPEIIDVDTANQLLRSVSGTGIDTPLSVSPSAGGPASGQIPTAPLPQQVTENRGNLVPMKGEGQGKENSSSSGNSGTPSRSSSRSSARSGKKSSDGREASSSKSRSARSVCSKTGSVGGESEKERPSRGASGVGRNGGEKGGRSASRDQWHRERMRSLVRGAEEDWLFPDSQSQARTPEERRGQMERERRQESTQCAMELDEHDRKGEVSGHGTRGCGRRGGAGKRGGRGRRGGGRKESESGISRRGKVAGAVVDHREGNIQDEGKGSLATKGSRTKSSEQKPARKPRGAERSEQSGGRSTARKQSKKKNSVGKGETKKGRGSQGLDSRAGAETDRITWEWICTTGIPTMKHVPKGIRREWGEIFDFALKKVDDEPNMEINWRMLMALPKLCLRTPPRGGRKKKGPSPRMCEWTMRLLMKARRGNWTELWEEAEEAGKKLEKKQKRGTGAAGRKQAEYVRRRVLELVSEGQYSRACKALVSEGVWELDEEVKEQLRKKHPQGEGWRKAEQVECACEEQEMGEAEEEQDVRVTFSEKQVERALRSFPKGTAAGGSGGRAQHWLDALDGTVGDGRKEMLKKMGKVCEILANGEAPSCIAPWLAGAPLFPLKKKGGGGIRPVAVGEVLRRLVAKMLAQDDKVKGAAEELFKEIGQLGVGIKGGAEIVVQAMRTWLSKKGSRGRGVLKLDFENAYNMIDRGEIAKQVAQHFPKLLPWFKFCYGVRGVLTCQGKRLPFDSCDGVQQGDPLGPLFFALGILKMGQKLKESLRESLPLWYLDDGSIVGPGDELVQAWDLVRKEADKVGMRLNVDKCEIWAWEGEEAEWMDKFPKEVRRVKESGFELLGCPVGDKEFSEKCVQGRVKKIKEVLDRLELLDDPQTELTLVRSCIGFPRFGFTLRSAPPEDIEEAVKKFDALMNEVAQKRFKVALSGDTEKQWHLPVRMGGIGIPKAQDVMAPGYLGNVFATFPYVRELVHIDSVKEMKGVEETWRRLTTVLEEEEGRLDDEGQDCLDELDLKIEEETLEKVLEDVENIPEASPPGQNLQHFIHSLVHLKRLRQWLGKEEEGEEEGSEGEHDARRDLLRKMLVMRGNKETGYAGDWLNVVPCEALGTKMRRAVFLTVLRWWLGGRINQADQCGVRKATGQMCGMELDKWGDHAVSCKVGPGVIARHNGVNLAWLLAEKAAGYTVQREQKVVFGGKKKPADTLVWGWKGEDACAQDWAVVHPLTKSSMKNKKLSPYSAVEKAEERKRRLEGEMCESAGVAFLPLAMDTFGGFGPSAAEALGVVADQLRTVKGEEEDDREYRAKRIAQKLRIVMLRYVARQILSRSNVGRTEEIQDEEEGWSGLVEDMHDDEEDEESLPQKTEVKEDAENAEEGLNERRQRGTVRGARKQQEDQDENADIEKQQNSGRREGKWKSRKDQKKMEKPEGKGNERTVLGWKEWRKDRELIGKDRWNLDWFQDAGLEVVEAGQGRGGECQYLSALVMADPAAWDMKDGRIVIKEERVDAVRRAVAEWMEKHSKSTFQSGLSLQSITLAEWKGGGQNRNEKWRRYLAGVRNGHSGQWGDDCTLMALSGVLGRPIYALSCGKDKRVRTYDVSAPFTWGEKIEGAPLLLAHVSDFHYCPVKVMEGGEWGFVLAPEEDRKDPEKRKNCKFLADERLVMHRTEAERGDTNGDVDPGGTHQISDVCGEEKEVQKQRFPNHRQHSRSKKKKKRSLSRASTLPPSRPPKEDSGNGNGPAENERTRKLEKNQVGQGRSYPFHQRPELPVSSERAVLGTEEEQPPRGISMSKLEMENEKTHKLEKSQVVQGRSYPFHQRPELPASSEVVVLGGEKEQPQSQHEMSMSRLEMEMRALQICTAEGMELDNEQEESEQRLYLFPPSEQREVRGDAHEHTFPRTHPRTHALFKPHSHSHSHSHSDARSLTRAHAHVRTQPHARSHSLTHKISLST